MDTITSLGNNICEYYHRIVAVCPPPPSDPEGSVHKGSCLQYKPQSKVRHVYWFISWYSMSFFQNITTQSLSGDDDRGFTHSKISLTGHRKLMNLPVVYSEVNPTGLPSGNVYVPLTSSNLTSSSNKKSEWRAGKRIRLVESCAKLHTDEISHESNIFLGSLSYKSKGRIEPFTINQWHAVPICRGGQLPMSLLWCYSSTCTTCKLRSNSCSLCQSASVGKVETTTMAHAQSAWRGQVCYTSWWTAHGDGLLQSPGPLGGREGIRWVEALQEMEFATPGLAHSFLKASHVTWTRHAIS